MKQQLHDERELFARMATGDVQAFTNILHHYNQLIYPVILRMLKSEQAAEEVVQDVFLKLWQNRANLAHIENHRAFLFAMASNRALDTLKKLSREKKMLTRLLEISRQQRDNNTTDILDFKESEGLVTRAVEQLPPQRKIIYKMSRYAGLSHKEIAEKLHISPNTVRNQLVEAVKFIKSFLNKMAG